MSVFEYLLEGHILDEAQAEELMCDIVEDRVSAARVAAIAGILRLRGIMPGELLGFRNLLRKRAMALTLVGKNLVDLCGTGGDGKDTFNISTAAAFVVAGAGLKVVKHGNHGFSSRCGSSTVIEALGIRLSADQSLLQQQLDDANITFLHAPLFHPALKCVQPVRKELAARTFFNYLGPLVNPANPAFHLLGVSDLSTARLYESVLRAAAGTEYMLVHSLDGYDEVSLTGVVRIVTREGITEMLPADFGLPMVSADALIAPATVEQAASLVSDILIGKGSEAQQSVVLANAALAIKLVRTASSLPQCVAMARHSIETGAAMRSLERLRMSSQRRVTEPALPVGAI